MGVLLCASRTEGGGWAAEWERNRGLGWVCWGQGWQGVEDTALGRDGAVRSLFQVLPGNSEHCRQ